MIRMPKPLLLLLLFLAAGRTWADDGYLVTRVVATTPGTLSLSLESLGERGPGRPTTETLSTETPVANLSTGEWMPPSSIHAGDILFKVERGSERQFSFLTPGKKVHASVAKADPEYAAKVDELSQMLAARLTKDARQVSPDDPNARALLFILELGLQAPLTVTQERVVEDALRLHWGKLTPEQRNQNAAFPGMVAQVMGADAKQWPGFRRELEDAARQWMKSAGPKDLVVQRMKAQIAESTKPKPGWKPAAPASAVTAYAELWSFAELLRASKQATVEQLSPVSVEASEQFLQAAWAKLPPAERAAVLRAPGLWASARGVLRHGNLAQQAKVRALLEDVAATAPNTRTPLAVNPDALFRLERALKEAHPWSQRFLR
jgi:hypothetical protein